MAPDGLNLLKMTNKQQDNNNLITIAILFLITGFLIGFMLTPERTINNDNLPVGVYWHMEKPRATLELNLLDLNQLKLAQQFQEYIRRINSTPLLSSNSEVCK